MSRAIAKPEAAPKRSLLAEWWKTVVISITTGALAYLGAMFLPPQTMYAKLFQQDPNDFSGSWTGAVDGDPATMVLRDLGEGKVAGQIVFLPQEGIPSRVIEVAGSHDSRVTLRGAWGDGRRLQLAFVRTVPSREGPDADLLFLGGDGRTPPARLCKPEQMSVLDCQELRGDTWFAKSARQ